MTSGAESPALALKLFPEDGLKRNMKVTLSLLAALNLIAMGMSSLFQVIILSFLIFKYLKKELCSFIMMTRALSRRKTFAHFFDDSSLKPEKASNFSKLKYEVLLAGGGGSYFCL